MLDRMVKHGLFVEWTFVQENLKDVKGELSEDLGEEPLWQREKKMQGSEVGKSLECPRRLMCLEWSEWERNDEVESQSGARYAGDVYHLQEVETFLKYDGKIFKVLRKGVTSFDLHFWKTTLTTMWARLLEGKKETRRSTRKL